MIIYLDVIEINLALFSKYMFIIFGKYYEMFIFI